MKFYSLLKLLWQIITRIQQLLLQVLLQIKKILKKTESRILFFEEMKQFLRI